MNIEQQSTENRIQKNQCNDADEVDLRTRTKKSSCRKTSILATLIFTLFTIIVMIIAVLVVNFTASKSHKKCSMTFNRLTKSSKINSSYPRFVAMNDLNNDKNLDIVVVNSRTNTIGIFLSYDNQTFSKQQIYSTGFDSHPSSIVINDFNHDHYFDIIVANSGTNNIGLFLGYNNGTFNQNQIIFSTGSFRPWFIACEDFNHDNQLDIAATSYNTDNIAIILSNRNGSFQQPLIYSTGYDSQPCSLVIADFDQDNHLDIAVANYGTDNIYIFLGYDNQTFQSIQIYITNFNSKPSSISLGDINNDQRLDLIVTNSGTGSIGLFLGSSNGTFTNQITYFISRTCQPQFVNVGYFNKNNSLDVVVIDSENDQIHILLDYTNETFSLITTYDLISGSYPMMAVVTDLNHDNQSDLIVPNYGTHHILILTGYFIEPSVRQTTYFVGSNSRPSAVVIYDFNNDNEFDLLVDNFNENYLVIFNGNNNGSFTRNNEYSTGNNSAPQYQCMADLNNDTYADIIVANLGSDSIGILLGQNNGSFNNVIIYSTGMGSNPWFVAVDDLNNDMYLDIVSANYGTNTLGIFMGYGNGSFADMILYSTGIGSNPVSIALGDLNHDDSIDIVVSLSSSSGVSIFLGNGTGAFVNFQTYPTGKFSNPFVVVLADFNRDNHLDCVLTNENTGNIGVFFGIENGSFLNQVTYLVGPGALPYFVTVIDYNHDHYLDIIVTNTGSDEVVIFFGDGNGNFELERRYSTGMGSGPYGIAIADLNNDKQFEIIVTYWGSGHVAVLTEYHAAKFINQTRYLTGAAPYPYSLVTGDLNNDNRSDIVVANLGTNDLSIYFTSGNNTFDQIVKYPIGIDSHPQYVITGDVNKDECLDIVTVNSKTNTMSIIMGDGNHTFTDQMTYSTGNNTHPSAIAMTDFNNDNRFDFVIANQGTDNIGIIYGFNYRSFNNLQTYSNKNNQLPYGIVVNDFNNDNYLDIAAVFLQTDNLAVLLGDENRSFGMMITTSTGIDSTPLMLAVSDFNNDKLMDIVVANYGTDSIGILLGYGNGSFIPMVSYSTGSQSFPRYVAVGDLNNDNQTDVVAVNSISNNIGIFLGYDNGSFSMMMTYSTGDFSNPYSVAINDINHDSYLDIVTVNYAISTISIFLGYGNGSFQTQIVYSTGYETWPMSIVINDFNYDNQLDIAVANFNADNIGIFLGYGNGSFDNVIPYTAGDSTSPESIAVGDFNNDNICDIVAANYGTSTIVVLFGVGDGTFLLGTEYSTGIGSVPMSLAIGDFNNDTLLDVTVANFGTDNIGILYGFRSEMFAGVTKYSTDDESKPCAVNVADFNKDGWFDVIVANYGTDNIGIFFGYGNQGFGSIIKYSTGSQSSPCDLAIGYINNDTQLDIVVVNSASDNILILFGLSNGTFLNGPTYSTGARSLPSGVVVGDVNTDSILDIIVAAYGTNSIIIYYGYGNGTLGNETFYKFGYNYDPTAIGIIDLNDDNWMDMIVSCYYTNHIETLVMGC